jgi:hypothetical protein
MEENKVRTYLFYAVGEIALVMIGILLALQVNNWNESRVKNTQETIYLNLLRDDLLLQKDENDIQRTAIRNNLSVENQLIDHIHNKFRVEKDKRDQVKKILSILLVGRTYGAYEATYIDLTSSGNIGLISDQNFKNQIIQHYQIQKRDRDVINNNTLNTYLDLWTKLVDRDLIMISPTLGSFAVDSTDVLFHSSFEFLDDKLFENLSKDENLILIQNVLAFKIASKRIADRYLDNSDERIDLLLKAIDRHKNAN